MRVTQAIQPVLELAAPLNNCLLAVLVTVLLLWLRRRFPDVRWRLLAVGLVVSGFASAYHLMASEPAGARWLAALNSPLFAVYLVIIMPALYLPRGPWRQAFMVFPAAILLLAAFAVRDAYDTVPPDRRGFYWLLIRPAFLIGGVVSLLVLIQPLLSLEWFRRAVRLTCFLLLVYGGFALRQDYSDYQAMLARRPQAQAGIMNLSETWPVLQSDRRMLYLPGAPCRFTADGGYVQGCNLEMFQRFMQLDFAKVRRGDPGTIGTLSVLLGALILFLCLCFLSGRWACGWLCPLSTLGGVLDWFRRRLGLSHLKPAQPLKLTYLFSGLGLAGMGLAMAKAYPHLDAEGKFAGCKIPIYPFCKICPSQQICPVAAHGPDNYPGLPTWEWGFGFFRVATIALLAIFVLSFAMGRRLWCRLCPMGMISGLFNRGGMVRLVKDASKCNRCGVCAEVCPMDIDLVRFEMNNNDVSSFDCVLCLKCVAKCPRDGCLQLEHAGKKVVESRFPLEV